VNNSILSVQRRVAKVESNEEKVLRREIAFLEDLRELPAWVLLGEPGSGKTNAFATEALACGGIHITIAEFINEDPGDDWKNKTLFLDGLDEIRSGEDRGVLLQVRTRLKRLGAPHFRVACRAADWLGVSDKSILEAVPVDAKLPVFNLMPLEEDDIFHLLEKNFIVPNPADFISQAKERGIDSLLANPHTLKLLVQGWKQNNWPKTRKETFENACKSQVNEPNKAHRDLARNHPVSDEDMFEAAGYLCAVMLLSDKSGIALDDLAESDRYPSLREYRPLNLDAAKQVLRRKIFIPSISREERLEPSHRSLAEYLAACWLAKEIDLKGLPLDRVLNLILGMDKKTVSGLRGLYAWLAIHSEAARKRLIQFDPMSVLLYGDVQSMTSENKAILLDGLKDEAEIHNSLLWEIGNSSLLINLYDNELSQKLEQILGSSLRDESTQSYVAFILRTIEQSQISSELLRHLKLIVVDDGWWGRIRTKSLTIWLNQRPSDQEVMDLLDLISRGAINDSDDELIGIILSNLYPRSISINDLLRYLQPPKETALFGKYIYFWGSELPKVALDDHLPIILDHLSQRSDLGLTDWTEHHLHRMVGLLVKRALEAHGESVTNQQLYIWLSIGADQYGENKRDKEINQFLSEWLGQRPSRYKGLLDLCFLKSAITDEPLRSLFSCQHILVNAPPPSDIGLWHFHKISETGIDILAQEHLRESVRTLIAHQGNQGLTLEMLLSWAKDDQIKNEWLEALLYSEIPDWKKAQIDMTNQHKKEQSVLRSERTTWLAKEIERIALGDAPLGLMYELAGVWQGGYIRTGGDSPIERFKKYCDNFEKIYAACQTGFWACVNRKDLPTIKEIFHLAMNNKEHFLGRPSLLGMDLKWEDDAAAVKALDPEAMKRMLCLGFTIARGKTSGWFLYFVEQKPGLVAEVLYEYAERAFKAQKEYIEGIYQLVDDDAYGSVAKIAVPKLLKSFPRRIKKFQMQHLECLLKSGLRYDIANMAAIIKEKVAVKTMDVPQKIYWLTAGMLIEPALYEELLWGFIGHLWQRARCVADFLKGRMVDLQVDYRLTAQTLARLIELLTPHAEFEWPKGGGFLTDPMHLGEEIRALISKLMALGTQDSLVEVDRLLALSSLSKIKHQLQSGRYELIKRIREENFAFPTLEKVSQILLNKAPVNSADLTSLVLAHLDDIASEIRESNSDIFRQFWNEKPTRLHKDENSCRDVILDKLKQSLRTFRLDCQPEGDYFNDKRADIRVSLMNDLELPIEIKGEWHDELWTSMNDQLTERYARAKNTGGHGIYVALWFDGSLQKSPKDGGGLPKSPIELQERLSAMVPIGMQNYIHVRVIDVSWPR